jgi:hypothetical protein
MQRKEKMKTVFRDIALAATALVIIGLSSSSIFQIASSHGSYFGISSMVMPAIAAVGGSLLSLLMMLFVLLKAGAGTLLITKGLPTVAALYSAQGATPSYKSALINIALPAAMAAAFIAHPVGGAAWAYTLFWIIPVVCEVTRRLGSSSLFVRLLAATFIAHAVGSVIWIYSVPTTPATWLGLLAVVPAERLVFASGATLGASALLMIKKSISQLVYGQGKRT